MNELIILTAKYVFLVSIIVWFGYLFTLEKGNKRTFLLRTLAAAALAYGLAKLAGQFYFDARPFVSDHITPRLLHANDNGFPSDHTLITSLLGFVILTKHRTLGVIVLLVALAVGASRVAAGIHHPLDIAGSFVISAIAVGFVLAIEKRLPHTDSTVA